MVVREHLTGGEEHELGLGRTKKCLCGKVGRKNSTYREAWHATIHGVAESDMNK